MKKAVVLLSGGLDSTTVLAMAAAQGRELYALSFRYGQRHAFELACAQRQARHVGVRAHEVVDISHLGALVASTSSLVSESELRVPEAQARQGASEIPSTYVPARNTLFLAYSLGWAEVVGAQEIWLGINAVDYSGYPDCRPEFVAAFEALAKVATKAGVEGEDFKLKAPLLELKKHEIIRAGYDLGVDYADTLSCYQPAEVDGVVLACGRCESCEFRREGFLQAGVADPTRYQGES